MAGTGSNRNGDHGNGDRGRSATMRAPVFAVVGMITAVVLSACGGATATLPASTGASLAPSLVAGASPSLEPFPSEPIPGDTTAPTVDPGVPTVPPTAAPAPSPTPNTNPRIATWDVPKYEDCTGSTAGSVTVSWEIRRATGVTISIDGPGIYMAYDGTSKTVTVPFGCDMTKLKHTYTLTTTGGTGPAAQITKTITARPAEVLSFSFSQPDCGPGDTFIGIEMSYEIRAATGAKLERDGDLYTTYVVKATNDIVQYDCSKASQTWKLTTTGGYGPEDSATVVVAQVVH